MTGDRLVSMHCLLQTQLGHVPYLLSIDSHRSMNHKLPGLPCAAGEQRPEDRDIQPPLQGSECHLCVGNQPRSRLAPSSNQSRPSAGRHLRSIVGREVGCAHGDDTADAAREHALPLALADLFTVVGARDGLGGPFLLEECAGRGGRGAESLQVIQVVLAP